LPKVQTNFLPSSGDRGSRFISNVGTFPSQCTTSSPGIQYCSVTAERTSNLTCYSSVIL